MKTKLGQGLIKGLKEMALYEKNKNKFEADDFCRTAVVVDDLGTHQYYPLITQYAVRVAIAEKANEVLEQILQKRKQLNRENINLELKYQELLIEACKLKKVLENYQYTTVQTGEYEEEYNNDEVVDAISNFDSKYPEVSDE